MDAFEKYRKSRRESIKNPKVLRVSWAICETQDLETVHIDSDALSASAFFEMNLEYNFKRFDPDADEDVMNAYRRIWMKVWKKVTDVPPDYLMDVMKDAGITVICDPE